MTKNRLACFRHRLKQRLHLLLILNVANQVKNIGIHNLKLFSFKRLRPCLVNPANTISSTTSNLQADQYCQDLATLHSPLGKYTPGNAILMMIVSKPRRFSGHSHRIAFQVSSWDSLGPHLCNKPFLTSFTLVDDFPQNWFVEQICDEEAELFIRRVINSLELPTPPDVKITFQYTDVILLKYSYNSPPPPIIY